METRKQKAADSTLVGESSPPTGTARPMHFGHDDNTETKSLTLRAKASLQTTETASRAEVRVLGCACVGGAGKRGQFEEPRSAVGV